MINPYITISWKVIIPMKILLRNMAQLMHDADLAIGSAGTASWERWCMGLPTLVKVIADNQKQIANKLENVGAISTWSNEYDLKRKLKSLISSSELRIILHLKLLVIQHQIILLSNRLTRKFPVW